LERDVTDRLTLAHALEGGGIARDAAEHIATEIFDAIHDNVATKSDLQNTEAALRNDLKAETAALRNDLKAETTALRNELKAETTALRNDLKAETTALRNELKTEAAALCAELGLIEHRLLTRVGSMIAVATGILVAIHYIH
jgi:phage host-nuclease inhibitor protein Gam